MRVHDFAVRIVRQARPLNLLDHLRIDGRRRRQIEKPVSFELVRLVELLKLRHQFLKRLGMIVFAGDVREALREFPQHIVIDLAGFAARPDGLFRLSLIGLVGHRRTRKSDNRKSPRQAPLRCQTVERGNQLPSRQIAGRPENHDRAGLRSEHVRLRPLWGSLNNFGCVRVAGCHGDPCREIEVECLPLPELFARHGVPYFLKVDIEGADKLCAQSLRGSAPLPPFVSFEFMAADAETILATLRDLGYRRFKMIYGACFTQSEPIFRQEFGMRLLRKLYRRLPPFRAGLDHLPDRLRPAKEEFQVFRARHPYAFPPGSSGPFAEETHGPWRNADYILAALDRVKRRAASDPQANLWYDIHASF